MGKAQTVMAILEIVGIRDMVAVDKALAIGVVVRVCEILTVGA
jgi:hypothetical protein